MMKTAISPWTIVATAGVTLGLSLLEINQVQAQTFTRSVNAISDTYLDSNSPNANFGTSDRLIIGQTFNNSTAPNGQQIPLLRFGNLPTLGPDQVAIVTDASLVLYGLDQRINVTRLVGNPISGAWNETTANFNNTNSLIDRGTILFTASNSPIKPRPPGGNPVPNTYQGAGLNQLVQNWLNSLSPNNGLALRATQTVFNQNRSDTFASKDNSTAAFRPTLNFTYKIVPNLWQYTGRVGGGSNPNTGQQDFRRTWETGCTIAGMPQSTNPPNPFNQEHWFWRSNQNVPFELTWNPTTKRLSAIFGGDTNSNTVDLPDKQVDQNGTTIFPGKHTLNCNFSNFVSAGDLMQGFALSVSSETDDPAGASCKTAAGSETFLQLTEIGTRQGTNINFRPINVTGTAIAPPTNLGSTASRAIFYDNAMTAPIEVIRGTARMNWPSNCNAYLNNGQSRLQFKLQGLGRLPNTLSLAAPLNVQSVPEPSVVLGLLAIGTLGIGTTFKRKHHDED